MKLVKTRDERSRKKKTWREENGNTRGTSIPYTHVSRFVHLNDNRRLGTERKEEKIGGEESIEGSPQGSSDDDLRPRGGRRRVTHKVPTVPRTLPDPPPLSAGRQACRSLLEHYTAALPHTTELRLRSTTPFTEITCSITSVLCKHDSPPTLSLIRLI